MSVYPSGKFVFPLGSCDGLILIFEYVNAELMLWNPLIKKRIIIPAFTPKKHPEASRNWLDTGLHSWQLRYLYFDSITNDYKIVFFYEEGYTIYSCKNGRWGERKDIPANLCCSVCVDGCIYDRDNGESVCFDTRDEKLHKFPQPKGVECLVDVKLEALSGRLCLYGFVDDDPKSLQLWVMEENGSSDKCWRELISKEIEKPDVLVLRPVCLSNEDDVVLYGMCDYVPELYKCFTYNSRKNCSFQEIKVDSTLKSIIPSCHDHYYPYSENLYIP